MSLIDEEIRISFHSTNANEPLLGRWHGNLLRHHISMNDECHIFSDARFDQFMALVMEKAKQVYEDKIKAIQDEIAYDNDIGALE